MQIIGTLQMVTVFTDEEYDTLITGTTKYAAKLLKKTDQCRMVAQCAHLFWTGRGPNGEAPRKADEVHAAECLRRSIKIANGIMNPVANLELLIEILNEYLYYYAQGCSKVEVKHIKSVLKAIQEHMDDLDEAGDLKVKFEDTVKYIKAKAKEADDTLFKAIIGK